VIRPGEVQIGPFTYTVTYLKHKRWCRLEPDHTDSAGVTYSDLNRIVVRVSNEDGQYGEGAIKAHLLHEIMHASCYVGNMQDQYVPKKVDIAWVEEQTIGVLSRPLLGVLRDNPYLVEYLTA
jgi:hypothetical protein